MSTSATPSRAGFLGRLGWQARQSTLSPRVVSIISPEDPSYSIPDISTILAENAKVKAELKKLRQRCEDYKTQSELNQDIMQECVAASKKDVDHLSADNQRLKKRFDHLLAASKGEIDGLKEQLAFSNASGKALTIENKSLKLRCEELTTQSQADKDMLRISSVELADTKEMVKSLQARLQHFENSTPSDMVSQHAEIASHVKTIKSLQASLTDLQEKYMRLTAMDCTLPSNSSNDIDLTRRIETLEFENSTLQDKLADRTADTKTRMLEYGDELNELADQLRHAEADAAAYSSELKMRNSQFLTLKAEFDTLSSELDSSRRQSRRFTRELLRQSHPNNHSNHNTSNTTIDILTEQLAQAHTTSVERDGLIEKFKEQYAVLARAVKREQGEKQELNKRVEEAWEENRGDRKRFEGVLKRRDGRIRELERRDRERVRGRVARVDSGVSRRRSRDRDRNGGRARSRGKREGR